MVEDKQTIYIYILTNIISEDIYTYISNASKNRPQTSATYTICIFLIPNRRVDINSTDSLKPQSYTYIILYNSKGFNI